MRRLFLLLPLLSIAASLPAANERAATDVDGHPTLIGLSAAGEIRQVRVDDTHGVGVTDNGGSLTVDGAVSVSSLILPAPATYSAVVVAGTPYAATTDYVCLWGSASKTIVVDALAVSMVATSAADVQVGFSWLVRDAASSGGGPAAVTAVPHDSTDAAATATVQRYTSAPTINGTVGAVAAAYLTAAGTTNLGPTIPWSYDLDALRVEPIVLRGTAEGLCLNLAGLAGATNLKVNTLVRWWEE